MPNAQLIDGVPIKVGIRLLPAGGEATARPIILTVVADGDAAPLIKTGSWSDVDTLLKTGLAEYAEQYAQRAEDREAGAKAAEVEVFGAPEEAEDTTAPAVTLLSLEF